MAIKSDEIVNGKYFHRWNTEAGRQGLKQAQAALASIGLELAYDANTSTVYGLFAGEAPDPAAEHEKRMREQAEQLERDNQMVAAAAAESHHRHQAEVQAAAPKEDQE